MLQCARITINHRRMQEIQPIARETEAFIQEHQGLKIASSEQYAQAADYIKLAQVKIKKLNDTRLEMTRPLDQSKKRIMDEFNLILDPLNAFVDSLKREMTTYHQAEQKRLAEERRKEEERLRKEAAERAKREAEEKAKAEAEGIPDLDIIPVSAQKAPEPVSQVPSEKDIKTQRGEVATVTMREDWRWELEVIEDVPREFLMVDSAKVTKAVRAGTRKIAGIKIYNAPTPVIR